MQAFLTPELINALLTLTSLAVTGFVGWLAPTLHQRWGIDLDDRARATLHSALNTGAHLAWSRVSNRIDPPDMNALIQILLAHVAGEGAGQAVRRLNVSQSALRSLAEAKLMEVGTNMALQLPLPGADRQD